VTTTRHGPGRCVPRSSVSQSPESNMESETTQGQLLTLDDRHKVAIHSYGAELWVAEFRGDYVELVRAAVWFRLRYGICHMSFSLRRARQFAVPLPNDMVAAIELLHQRRLEPAPWCSSFRPISAGPFANRPASIIIANLLQRGRLIRDRLVASRKPSDRVA
jgi:hypothetical protein